MNSAFLRVHLHGADVQLTFSCIVKEDLSEFAHACFVHPLCTLSARPSICKPCKGLFLHAPIIIVSGMHAFAYNHFNYALNFPNVLVLLQCKYLQCHSYLLNQLVSLSSSDDPICMQGTA